MDVRFEDDDLDRLETDPTFHIRRLPVEIQKSYRRAMQFIRAATGEPALRARRSWRFEEYREAPGIYSIRLNDQWRLFFRMDGSGDSRALVVLEIRDPH